MFIDFRERVRGGVGRERHRLVASHTHPRDRTCNLGTCPDRGSNPQPFAVQDDASTNGATRPGLEVCLVY